MPQAADVFNRLSRAPLSVSEDDFAELERFVVLLYSRTSSLTNVNNTLKHLFSYCNRQLEHIPPTAAALLQHVKREAYQAGHVWGQALISNPE